MLIELKIIRQVLSRAARDSFHLFSQVTGLAILLSLRGEKTSKVDDAGGVVHRVSALWICGTN